VKGIFSKTLGFITEVFEGLKGMNDRREFGKDSGNETQRISLNIVVRKKKILTKNKKLCMILLIYSA